MPPQSEDTEVHSTWGMKPTSHRTSGLRMAETWLEDKKLLDGAENLWRVHDDLYDLTDFIKSHPGGPDWLRLTKGTDITEAFEVHHISDGPKNLLKKFHIRKAVTPRNAPFTFEEDGFYKTLRRKVQGMIKTLPKQPARTSDFFADALCFGTILFAVLANVRSSYFFGAISGSLLAQTTIAAHNYFHKRDNFRMYYFNLSFMDYKEWRIAHVLSHHLFTNSVLDLEISFVEPIVQFLPVHKSFWGKYGPWVYSPILWTIMFHMAIFQKLYHYFVVGRRENMARSDLVTLVLPISMYLFGNQSILGTFVMWNFVQLVGSFHFFLVGFNAAHHHPDIFHDGDTPRAEKNIDWGIAELDSVMDRTEITGSHYLVLTNFGDHALHHMFPTLDHGILANLYPVFRETLKEFNLEVRFTSQFSLIKGQFQQLARTEPNPHPPGFTKKDE